jgi:hypothetical protein
MPKLAQMTVHVNAFYVKTVALPLKLRRLLGAKPRFFPNDFPELELQRVQVVSHTVATDYTL